MRRLFAAYGSVVILLQSAWVMSKCTRCGLLGSLGMTLAAIYAMFFQLNRECSIRVNVNQTVLLSRWLASRFTAVLMACFAA